MREDRYNVSTEGYWGSSSKIPCIRRTYDSMLEYLKDARAGLPHTIEMKLYSQYASDYFDPTREANIDASIFHPAFHGFRRFSDLIELCQNGWEEKLPETLEISQAAVQMIERDVEVFEPVAAVSGMAVDVAAAITGLPEDMIDFPLTQVSNVGTVVTVCCDVQCHADVSAASIIKRGMVIVALALALERQGHGTELWVSDEYTDGHSRVVLRTLVKGPNDYVNPAKILFAYSHPGVQRGLGFSTVAGLPQPWSRIPGDNYGSVTSMTHDMPEGTLYIEPQFRFTDNPHGDRELRMYLAQLGLLYDPDLD